MDRTNLNVMSLFATPPHDQSQQQQQQQPPQQQVSPTQSYREPAPASPPKSIDSLFQNLTPQQQQPEQTPPATSSNMNNPFRTQAQTQPANSSAPATPVSSASAGSGGVPLPPADRQSALLTSLLGSSVGSNGGSPNMNPTAQQIPQPLIPHQPPSPPSVEQRTRPLGGGNEAQGKFLLEQLMSGNLASSFNDLNQGTYPPPAPMSYPPQPYGPYLTDTYQLAYQDPSHLQPQPQPHQQPQSHQQPPSPSRKSMFDFVSPFDALANTSQSQPKKKPVPELDSREGEDVSSWASQATDPKRKSMENLMDQLTRSSQQNQSQGQLPQPQPDVYGPEPTSPPIEIGQFQTKGLYGMKQQIPGSPRGSPPRAYQVRSRESPSGQVGKGRSEGSPVRGSKIRALKSKTYINSPLQSQNIIFDVSLQQETIQASRDCVKSTAIALVKVDPTFLPGTTIGATHWVAYAMTRGRVRVISRSSGDRTLLQLPTAFGPTISVTDMAVYGNRLAGVTSDGGFVVWELPEVITDDVPGKVLVCIVPHNEIEPLHSVKWHPKDPDTLAVASDSKIFLLNVAEAANVFRGAPFTQQDLQNVAQIFRIDNAPLVSFDFDIPHQALATITEDSMLTLWNVPDKVPFWSQKITGEGIPSSLTFLDGGVVIGRKNGTIFQLLPVMGDVILSTVKFVNGGREDPEMFGHVTYDSRIQTLWVANSKRDSLIALKVCFELSTPSPGGEELIRGGYFEQLVEFVGPKPTLNFVILTADSDPTGDEASAACIAAKLPPGDLALVAFSVHSSGVDQVLIRKEWYDSAFLQTNAKFPPFNPTMVAPPLPEARQQRTIAQPPQVLSQPIPSVPIRLRTPPSEEVEIESIKDDVRSHDAKGKAAKGPKNVGWKDKEDSSSGNGKGKEKEKLSDSAIINETPLGVALSKEIRKVEESLHTRIGRLIAKELDKQQQRLEEARANEQAADFARQEKILKLISTELTKNTTRVVESAVKSEVQNSVLPSLEGITRTEVKSAINTQISKGVSDSVRATMPPEIEKMFIKPELANRIALNMSNSLVPAIERHVKETVAKTLIPAFQAQSSVMHQDLSREIRSEITNLKKEMINWQSEAFRNQENMIRDMDQAVRSLSEQIKFMTMNLPTMGHSSASLPTRTSPSSSTGNYVPAGQSPMGQSHHRQNNLPPMSSNYQTSFQPQPQPPSGIHNQWYGPNLPGPPQGPVIPQLASQPVTTPPAPKTEEWDDTYLAVLGTQDLKQLRELLARSSPEVIMPTNGPGPLSQAVILTLVHRLAAAIGETPPVDEAFKSSLWWLQRAATTLNTSDPLISPYIGRVLPNVSQMLNTTKQRLGLLPGGPQLVDSTRLISDIQETLSRKPIL